MMKLEVIDLLVVGLPVAVFAAKKFALEKLMTGRHDVGGGKTVLVRKALAMAQPNGALIDYATQHNKVEAMGHEQSLVIDPGSRTFDRPAAFGLCRHCASHSHGRNDDGSAGALPRGPVRPMASCLQVMRLTPHLTRQPGHARMRNAFTRKSISTRTLGVRCLRVGYTA